MDVQAKNIELQNQGRRELLKLVGKGVIAVSGITSQNTEAVVTHNVLPRDRYTKIGDFTSMRQEGPMRLLDLQKFWKNNAFMALSIFENADPRVKKFKEFMSKNAFYTIPVNERETALLSNEDKGTLDKMMSNPMKFEVVFMPEKYALSMLSSVTVHGNTMRVAAEFRCLEWLGIILTHELSHIYDLIVNKENPTDQKQYLDGEIDAHVLEMKLLKSWSPLAYERLIREGTPLYLSNQRQKLFEYIDSLYPIGPGITTTHEGNLARASCMVAIVFEDVIKKGGDKVKLREVYKNMVNQESKR